MTVATTWLAGAMLMVASSAPPAEPVREWQDGQWVAVAPPAKGTPAGELSLVRQLFEQKKYKESVEAARAFRKSYADDKRYEEVCLLAGRAEIGRGRYWQAYDWFESQLDAFPSGPLSGRALHREFEVAEAFLAGKKRIVLGFLRLPARSEGLEILARIAEHAPATEIAAKALLRIGQDHYLRREWPEAAEGYDAFCKLFPKHTETAEATLQAARATWYSYGGPEKDDTPLIEAEQRFRNIIESFPEAARQAGAAEIVEQITRQQAGKLLQVARFYVRINQKQAAAYYYRLVIDQFAESYQAQQAETALAQLGPVQPVRPGRAADKPPVPSKGDGDR